MRVCPKGGFPKKDSSAPPPPPPVRVAVYAEDRIVGLETPTKYTYGEFLRGLDGGIARLRIFGRVHARLEVEGAARHG